MSANLTKTRMDDFVELVRASPDGITTEAVAARLGVSVRRMLKFTGAPARAGLVVSVPFRGAARGARWVTPERAPIVRAQQHEVWAEKRRQQARQRWEKARQAKNGAAQITVAQAFDNANERWANKPFSQRVVPAASAKPLKLSVPMSIFTLAEVL